MNEMHLERHDPDKNLLWFYQMSLRPAFSAMGLWFESGAGRVRPESCARIGLIPRKKPGWPGKNYAKPNRKKAINPFRQKSKAQPL